MQKTKIIQLISISLLLLNVTSTAAETNNQSDIKTTYTSLNRCPVTDRHSFKREKLISEQCEAKEDFAIFIEGDTEETWEECNLPPALFPMPLSPQHITHHFPLFPFQDKAGSFHLSATVS